MKVDNWKELCLIYNVEGEFVEYLANEHKGAATIETYGECQMIETVLEYLERYSIHLDVYADGCNGYIVQH